MKEIESDVVNSRAVVGTTEMHGGTKKQGRDQLVCALFKKVVTHVRCYVGVRNDKSMTEKFCRRGCKVMSWRSVLQPAGDHDTHPRWLHNNNPGARVQTEAAV